MKRMKFNNKGFSLVEVLVAIVVITIAASAILSGFVQASRVNLKSQRMQDATNLAQVTAELFKSRSAKSLVDTYSSGGYAAEGIEVIDSGDFGNGVRTIEFKNIKEEYIYDGRTYDEDFKVDVTLDSTRYAAATNITTTYDQESKLSQSNVSGDNTVVSNTFMVPVMKEAGNNLVIKSSESNDANVIALYKADVESAFTTAYVNALGAGAAAAQIQAATANAITDADRYVADKYPSSNIVDCTVNGPTRKIKLHIKCEDVAAVGRARIKVYITADYIFQAVNATVNGRTVSIPSKTYNDVAIISESSAKNYTFSKLDGKGIQDIYFYMVPIDGYDYYHSSSEYRSATTGKDSVTVYYYQNATGIDESVIKINCYVVAQNFERNIDLGNPSSKVTCIPVFNSGSFSVIPSNTPTLKVYNNFQMIASGKLQRASSYGYITDGGSNEVVLYDMTIKVYLDGKEYAVIQTTKED